MPLLSPGYERPRLPGAVLLDSVRSIYKVGAFFRAADGVSLEKLYLCGITAHPPTRSGSVARKVSPNLARNPANLF